MKGMFGNKTEAESSQSLEINLMLVFIYRAASNFGFMPIDVIRSA